MTGPDRPRLATVWLDGCSGCSGCHMSFLDMDERLLELRERADLVYSPLVDAKDYPPEADLIYHTLNELLEGRMPDTRTSPASAPDLEVKAVAREIVIEPVTRIEGHAKITIQLGDDGQVADAHFHVTQFRGFERICQGRPVHELPSIMARICGICPVSHLIASAKACDQILATEPPPTAVDLRRIMNLAQVAQSHALSFFHLSSPDLLFGFDAEAGGRDLFGVLGATRSWPVTGSGCAASASR